MTTRFDMRPCSNCLEGEVWESCTHCDGYGYYIGGDGGDCPKCGGAGEVKSEAPCSVCGGRGEARFELLSLWSADKHVRQVNPDWSVDDGEPGGVTVYSQAHYYRRRDEIRGKVARLKAWNHPEIEHLVECFDEHGNLVIDLRGLCWGYGGEGPTGFADILCDMWPHKYPTKRDAMLVIASYPMEENWEDFR